MVCCLLAHTGCYLQLLHVCVCKHPLSAHTRWHVKLLTVSALFTCCPLRPWHACCDELPEHPVQLCTTRVTRACAQRSSTQPWPPVPADAACCLQRLAAQYKASRGSCTEPVDARGRNTCRRCGHLNEQRCAQSSHWVSAEVRLAQCSERAPPGRTTEQVVHVIACCHELSRRVNNERNDTAGRGQPGDRRRSGDGLRHAVPRLRGSCACRERRLEHGARFEPQRRR